MSRFLKKAAVLGAAFGLLMSPFFVLQGLPLGIWGIVFGVGVSLAAGLLFGLLMAGFAEWQRSRFTREDPCAPGEQLLKQGPANHFRGWEGVGGWLYLTDKRLLFRPHRVNLQKGELSIPLEEIREVEACATAWVVPNGLRVVTEEGAERFVVEGRRSWVEEMNRALELLA